LDHICAVEAVDAIGPDNPGLLGGWDVDIADGSVGPFCIEISKKIGN
jgi:hypothetical protein